MLLAGVAGSAQAQLPPSTYEGPLGSRLAAQASCTWGHLDQYHLNMPQWIPGNWLRGTAYVNPTTCQIVAAPGG
jgi:hypothetical protein